jgi:hypothetical protein
MARFSVPVGAATVPTVLGAEEPQTALSSAAVLDLLAKVILLASVVRLALDPEWGNLEGKAPLARAILYPCLGLVVPALHLVVGHGRPFPWKADLLVTAAGFSDILGNRLDLYDRIEWFDDWIHFMNTGFIAAAALLLTTAARTPFAQLLDRAVAVGLSVSLAWEVWEYYAFVTRSAESATAYPDTIGDLVLGGLGAGVAAAVVAVMRGRSSRTRRSQGLVHRGLGVRPASTDATPGQLVPAEPKVEVPVTTSPRSRAGRA